MESSAAMRRGGRRPGGADTRGTILTAARAAFAERGYGASLRQVAAAAEVDPALLLHYFGSKRGLFVAAMDLPVDPAALLEGLLAAGSCGLGRRVAATFLGIWDEPAGRERLLGLVRSAVADGEAAAMLRAFVIEDGLAPAIGAAGADDPDRRAALMASQLLGLVLVRYVLAIEPIASLPADRLAGLIGPTLQRYLTADLDAEHTR